MAITRATVGGKVTAAIENAQTDLAERGGSTTITPTSVGGSGVSVSTAGKVTFAAATTISLNGVFSSTYDCYEIWYVGTHTAATPPQGRVRLSGTDNSSAVYDKQRLSGSSATASAGQNLAQTAWDLGGSALAGRHKIRINIENVAVAAATNGDYVITSVDNPMTASANVTVGAIQHRTSTAYDGITFFVSSGTTTGYVVVRGYNSQA